MSDLLKPPSDHVVKLAPPWVSTFRSRNTFEILWSCIFTLVFSAWTMWHPKIPTHKERKKEKGSLRAKIARLAWQALCGLLLPEFVLLYAIMDYIRARRTIKRLNVYKKPKPKTQQWQEPSKWRTFWEKWFPPKSDLEAQEKKLPSRWQEFWEKLFPPNLERGFHAGMGGFELVEPKDGDGPKYGDEPKDGDELKDGDEPMDKDRRRTLTAYEVVILVAFGFNVKLSIGGIHDRSKAVLFTKLITTGQALWMVVQVLVRNGVGLPITLLEFNTVLHVICALVAWVAWLRKPKDIRRPTKINIADITSDIRGLLHVKDIYTPFELLQRSRKFKHLKESVIKKILRPDRILRYTPSSDSGTARDGGWTLVDANDTQPYPADWDQKVGGVSIMDSTTSTLEKYLIRFHDPIQLTTQWGEFLVEYSTKPGKVMGKSELAWKDYRKEVNRSSVLAEPTIGFYWISKPTMPNIYRALDSQTTFITGLVLILLSAIYGAIHCATWNSYFPTVLERYLWRYSGIATIIGIPVIFLSFAAFIHLYDFLTRRIHDSGLTGRIHDSGLTGRIHDSGFIGWVELALGFIDGIFLSVTLLLYFCARLYMIVEGFLSLRSLPESTYENIRWLDMWPHL